MPDTPTARTASTVIHAALCKRLLVSQSQRNAVITTVRMPTPMHAEHAIHHDAERRGSLAADRRLLQQVVAFDQIAAGAAGNEQAEEQPDHQQAVEPPP